AVHRQAGQRIVSADEHSPPVSAHSRVMVVPAGKPLTDFLLEALALLGILDSLEEFSLPPFVSPGGNNADKVVVAAGVRINIGLHISPPLSCGFDESADLLHSPPILLVG